MKKILPLITFSLLFTFAHAQSIPTPIIQGEFLAVTDALVVDNNMYITALAFNTPDSEIEIVDLSQTNPSIQQTFFHPDAFTIDIDGDTTYIMSLFGDITQADTVDLGNEIPITTIFDFPIEILAIDDFLYITAGDFVSRIDLNNPTVLENVVDANFPQGMALIGDELYVAVSGDNTIGRINITDTTPSIEIIATGFDNPSSLAVDGTTLYVGEFSGVTSSIFSLDTTIPNPTPELIAENVGNVVGLSTFDNDLYFVETGSGTLFRLDDVLSSDDFNNTQVDFKIFPNPSDEQITISGFENSEIQNVKLYNLAGQLISQERYTETQIRDTSDNILSLNLNLVPEGVYIVQLTTTSGVTINKRLIVK